MKSQQNNSNCGEDNFKTIPMENEMNDRKIRQWRRNNRNFERKRAASPDKIQYPVTLQLDYKERHRTHIKMGKFVKYPPNLLNFGKYPTILQNTHKSLKIRKIPNIRSRYNSITKSATLFFLQELGEKFRKFFNQFFLNMIFF